MKNLLLIFICGCSPTFFGQIKSSVEGIFFNTREEDIMIFPEGVQSPVRLKWPNIHDVFTAPKK